MQLIGKLLQTSVRPSADENEDQLFSFLNYANIPVDIKQKSAKWIASTDASEKGNRMFDFTWLKFSPATTSSQILKITNKKADLHYLLSRRKGEFIQLRAEMQYMSAQIVRLIAQVTVANQSSERYRIED
jgi:hypothetical protein